MATLAERFEAALNSFEKDHDFGIMWEYDERKAGVVVGPNALAGFPFASGQGEHLNRLEAIVIAAEAAAIASKERIA